MGTILHTLPGVASPEQLWGMDVRALVYLAALGGYERETDANATAVAVGKLFGGSGGAQKSSDPEAVKRNWDALKKRAGK